MALQMDNWSYFTLLKTGDQARFVAMSPAQLLHLRLDLSVNLAAASSATTRDFGQVLFGAESIVVGKNSGGIYIPLKKGRNPKWKDRLPKKSIFKGANC